MFPLDSDLATGRWLQLLSIVFVIMYVVLFQELIVNRWVSSRERNEQDEL